MTIDIMLQLISDVDAAQGSSAKIAMLAKYKDNTLVRQILEMTYSPYIRFHITSDQLKKRQDLCEITADRAPDTNFFSILDGLRRRNITGHKAIALCNGFCKSFPTYADLFCR